MMRSIVGHSIFGVALRLFVSAFDPICLNDLRIAGASPSS
jgi:hypothetical protein